jgi:hypothetical protein
MFWGSSKVLHVNESDALKMIRGSQDENRNQEPRNSTMTDPLEDEQWRAKSRPKPLR